jgi:hypothetical protein
MAADGIPETVSAVLEPRIPGAVLTVGHFERKTEMPGKGNPSQTDLLAICQAPDGQFVMAVEGKVTETFGPLVKKWDDASPNRRLRIDGIRSTLGDPIGNVGGLRYQLLHRTAAAVIEADRFGVGRAVMLVHSFDPNHAGFQDFARFADWIGAPCSEPGTVSDWIDCSGIALALGWCTDQPFGGRAR